MRANEARSRSSLLTKTRAGDAAVVGDAPRNLGLHLDAFDRGHDEDGEVGDAQRGGDVADEVGVARRVDDVDLVALVLERGDRQRHRDAAAGLFGVEVGDGVAVLDLPEPGDRARHEEQRLGERGLPGAAVADQRDVADLLRRKRLQTVPPDHPTP